MILNIPSRLFTTTANTHSTPSPTMTTHQSIAQTHIASYTMSKRNAIDTVTPEHTLCTRVGWKCEEEEDIK